MGDHHPGGQFLLCPGCPGGLWGSRDAFSVLKFGFSFPFPDELVKKFLTQVDKVLVVEELEPIMEEAVRSVAQIMGTPISIQGKGVGQLSRLFEYDPARVENPWPSFSTCPIWAEKRWRFRISPPFPGGRPTSVPGCPHRSTFYAIKQIAGEEAIYPTDIGCYTLGISAAFQHRRFPDLHGFQRQFGSRVLPGLRPAGHRLYRRFHLFSHRASPV